MSSLILPSRFTQQPRGRVELHPNAGSFSSALVFNGSQSLLTENTAGNVRLLNDAVESRWQGDYCTSSYYVQKVDAVGGSLHATGPNTINIGWRKPISDLISNKFTVLFVLKPDTLTTVSHVLTSSDSAQFDIQFQAINVAGDTVTLRNIWSGHWTAGADAAFTNAGFARPFTVIAVTYDGANKVSYVNKQKVTHTGVGYTPPTGNGVLLSVAAGGNAYAFYAAKRALCDAEIFALVDNPWQIFKPRKRVIYFDVSSSFPVLSSLAVSNITSSGGRLTASA